MTVIRAEAIVSAKDATGRTFEQIAGKIRPIADAAKSLAGIKMTDFTATWGRSFQDQLDKMRVSMREQVRLARDFSELSRTIHPSNLPGIRTHEYLSGLDRWKTLTIANLRQVKAEAEATNRALGPFARGALGIAGAAGVAAPGYVAWRGIRGSAIAVAEQNREDARNWLSGMTPEEQKRARAVSKQFSARYSLLDESQVQARLRNLRAFTGSLDGALGLLDNDLQALTVLQSLRGKDDAMGQFRQLYKGLDILNFTEKTGDAKRLIDAFIKAQSVDPDIHARDWALAARYSRSGGMSLSDEFLGAVLPTLIQDLGGSQVGTMLQQNIAQNIGNRIKKESLQYQASAGLRDADGNFVGRDLLMSNPYLWTQKYLPDALKKLGLDPGNHNDLVEFSAKAFSNQRVAELFTKLLSQKDQIERNISLFRMAPGIGAAGDLRNRDAFVANEGVFAQLRNLGAQIAAPIMEMAIPAINLFSDAIAGLTKRLSDNPTVNAAVSLGTAAVGAAGAGAGLWWLGNRYLPKGTLPFVGRAALRMNKIGLVGTAGYLAYDAVREVYDDIKNNEKNGHPYYRQQPIVPNTGGIRSTRPENFAWRPDQYVPDALKRSPLRIGDDRPQLNLGPLPGVGNIPAKAEVSGSIDVKSKVDVSLDDNMLRVRVQSIVEPMLRNFQVNGNATGTAGSSGRSMPEAEFQP